MRILDINNNEIINPDLTLGYLIEDKIISIHHDAIPPVEEVGHYEVVRTYPNGGKLLNWIVTTPGSPGQEAWDEYEDIYRYILYTQEELDEIAAEQAREQAEAEAKRQAAEVVELVNALLGVSE